MVAGQFRTPGQLSPFPIQTTPIQTLQTQTPGQLRPSQFRLIPIHTLSTQTPPSQTLPTQTSLNSDRSRFRSFQARLPNSNPPNSDLIRSNIWIRNVFFSSLI